MLDLSPEQGKGGIRISTVNRYREWVDQFLIAQGIREDSDRYKLRGSCWSACTDMVEEFPELRLVRGWVTSPEFAESASIHDFDPGDGHWWLETESGEIVDPTAKQFSRPVLFYFPLDESKASELPTGKCPNCGGYCYGGKDLCSDECARSYAAYCTREMSGAHL